MRLAAALALCSLRKAGPELLLNEVALTSCRGWCLLSGRGLWGCVLAAPRGCDGAVSSMSVDGVWRLGHCEGSQGAG